MGTKLSRKKYLLVICEILGLFVNNLTAVHKFSLLNRDKLTQPIKIQLSKKQERCLNFFQHFGHVGKILNTFKKTMILIGDVFPKLRIPKSVVR